MNMNKPINLLVGGLTLFAAQGCKAPKQVAEQVEHPNIIYVFPDQYRNQALGIWSQNGFQDKVNFKGDPVHTPNLDAFARESIVLTSAQSNCPLSSPHRGMLLTGMPKLLTTTNVHSIIISLDNKILKQEWYPISCLCSPALTKFIVPGRIPSGVV